MGCAHVCVFFIFNCLGVAHLFELALEHLNELNIIIPRFPWARFPSTLPALKVSCKPFSTLKSLSNCSACQFWSCTPMSPLSTRLLSWWLDFPLGSCCILQSIRSSLLMEFTSPWLCRILTDFSGWFLNSFSTVLNNFRPFACSIFIPAHGLRFCYLLFFVTVGFVLILTHLRVAS